MSPRGAREHKPRAYEGSVDWMDQARQHAESWPDDVLEAVMAHWPYGENPTHVRHADWVDLVAHVSLRREADPATEALRLAMYVTGYRERYHQDLSPARVKETQT